MHWGFTIALGLLALLWLIWRPRLYDERGFTPDDPATQLLRAHDRDVQAIEQELVDGVKALGLHRATPVGLAREPALLDDCARFERAEPLVDAWRSSIEARFARHARDMSNVAIEEKFKPAIAQGLSGWRELYATYLPKRVALTKRQLANSCRLCRLLARKNWKVEHNSFRFFDPGDEADFHRILDELGEIGEQHAQVIMAAARSD